MLPSSTKPDHCPRCYRALTAAVETCPYCGQRLSHAETAPEAAALPEAKIVSPAMSHASEPSTPPAVPADKPATEIGSDPPSLASPKSLPRSLEAPEVEHPLARSLPPRPAVIVHKPSAAPVYYSRPTSRSGMAVKITATVSVVAAIVLIIVGMRWLRPNTSAAAPVKADPQGQPMTLDLTKQVLTDEHREILRNTPSLRRIYLDGSDAGDDELKLIGEIKGLRWLYARKTKITDEGLEAVAQLKYLERLHLFGTGITDAGLVKIARLSHLQVLGLSDCKMTDAGLAQLKKLSHLETLGMSRTAVTDASLSILQTMPQLKLIDLRETKVTASAVESLQKALPNCKIKR